jgi:hypothetical protein
LEIHQDAGFIINIRHMGIANTIEGAGAILSCLKDGTLVGCETCGVSSEKGVIYDSSAIETTVPRN